MESSPGKFSSLRNLLVRVLLFSILIIVARFTYIVTIAGESCSIGDFCFISLPKNLNFAGNYVNATPGEDWIKTVRFYSSVFQDLIKEGYLSPNSKSLCIETLTGDDVSALKEIGIPDSVGIFKKELKKPFVIKGEAHRIPFDDNSFDFVFSGGGRLDVSRRPIDFATEIGRTLKPLGFAVVHVRARDRYSFDSFIDLFNCCKLVKSRDIDGVGFFYDDSMPLIREYVLKKESRNRVHENVHKNCSVLGFKHELVRDAEPLILDEPLKPWLTLKRNVKNIKYLPSMVDISFKNRYVYVDVGARSYGSSIGSWFKKQYPKQNKTFQVYAIEADQAFHDQYRLKKGVALLPYAAWVRNETLAFEINKDPGKENDEKGRGMGRIRPVRSSGDFDGEVNVIEGFDFADWLKNTVSEKDFVVVKMDVEGTEFELIPRLLETGAICLIDEMFLECHYNRWQRCCPGERSAKYEKTYSQCLELFTSLRQRGVLVHQWW